MSLESDRIALLNIENHEGFVIYQAYLKKRFDELYKKLRKTPRDSSYYKTQGGLDELEWAIKLPQVIISRGEL